MNAFTNCLKTYHLRLPLATDLPVHLPRGLVDFEMPVQLPHGIEDHGLPAPLWLPGRVPSTTDTTVNTASP